MGTVLISTICHYCNGRATTEDHIVPRCALPKPMSRLPEWYRSSNVVPACKHCNNRKGALRSSCGCDQCSRAWGAGLACFIVEGWSPRGIWLTPLAKRALKPPKWERVPVG